MPVLAKPKGFLQESDSVTESTPVRMLRKAGQFLGLDDPQTAVDSLTNPLEMTAPLVSIFKNKAAREAATEMFRTRAAQVSPTYGGVGYHFANDYPRIAAHMSPMKIPQLEALGADALGAAAIPNGKVTMPLPVGITPLGVEVGTHDAPQAMNTLYHEGTHVAQALGNSDTRKLYSLADDLAGYHGNPFEQSARYSGDLASTPNYLPRPKQPLNAMKGLENLSLIGGNNHPSAQALTQILRKRLGRDPEFNLPKRHPIIEK